MLGVWPAALTAGLAFAIPQFLISNFHGPWLVDIVASVSSLAATGCLLKFWQPKDAERLDHTRVVGRSPDSGQVFRAWLPWVLLSLFVFVWGVPDFKQALDKTSAPQFEVAGLHKIVQRTPPVVPPPSPERPTKPEEAVYRLNWLSATGTGILFAAVVAGLVMGFSPFSLLKVYGRTLVRVRLSLITIAAMLALGYVTRYSGTDATLGLALARTGKMYPFFGTLLGWLGVALTGSDTASNVLFGSLQKITAEQTGLNPSSWRRPTVPVASWARWWTRKVLSWPARPRTGTDTKAAFCGTSSSTVSRSRH